MNHTPIARAIAMYCGLSTPKPRLPVLVYALAGGPFHSIKV